MRGYLIYFLVCIFSFFPNNKIFALAVSQNNIGNKEHLEIQKSLQNTLEQKRIEHVQIPISEFNKNIPNRTIENSNYIAELSANIKKYRENLETSQAGFNGWHWPTISEYVITSCFGERRGNDTHTGLDIAVPVGTDVYAAREGTVKKARYHDSYGYGIYCIIEHGDGSEATVYAHMKECLVEIGSTVKKGQVIGTVGITGCSTGPHLHFEYRVNNKYIDPLLLFADSSC